MTDLHTMLGLARGEVRLVPHQPHWAAAFEMAAEELRMQIREPLCAVEHIGSTAVAGLAAKPIIDVMAGVVLPMRREDLVAALSVIGYEHRPLDAVHGRMFFARGPYGQRTHNLSMCEFGSAFWSDRLVFREALRADAALARDYGELKRRLAEQFPHDRLAYTEAKEPFIRAAMAACTTAAFNGIGDIKRSSTW